MSTRFAICTTGDIRGFARLAPPLEQRLLLPTKSGGGAAVDLFFHVWSDGSPLEQQGERAMRELPQTTGIVVEPTAMRRNLTAATFGWPEHVRMQGGGSFEAFRSQWRKVHLCFAMAFAHAAAMTTNSGTTGPYYAAYVRTRADFLQLVPHDLAAEHQSMAARALSMTSGKSSEYLVMQHCLAPWPLSVSDQWFVATPKTASGISALPLPREPSCCHEWMEHRLQSMGVVEGAVTNPNVAERDSATSPACARKHNLARAGLGDLGGGRLPLFMGRFHSMQLGGRCFTEKMTKKKRLAADDESCVLPTADEDTTPEGLATYLTLRPATSAASPAPMPPTNNDPLVTMMGLENISFPNMRRVILKTACRCANGFANGLS